MTERPTRALPTLLIVAAGCSAREVDLATAKVRCDVTRPCPSGRCCAAADLPSVQGCGE